ncbi:MAG: flagellar basal body-associated FliL family protein [Planctomycetota bacterium]
MADEQPEKKAEEAAEEGKKSKLPIKLIGALVGVVGLGAALAMMAIPKGPKEIPRFTGPYFHQLFDKQIVSNTKDNDFKRFIKMNPQVEFSAYDGTYLTTRNADPLYKAWLEDNFNSLMSGKQLDEIYNGSNRERFAQEIRESIEAALFPVHVGETPTPLEADAESGIRPGDSYRLNTFSGAFWEHTLTVDNENMTLAIDGGPTTAFEGNELDLKVIASNGEYIYLDVSSLNKEFSGDLHLGVMGRIRQVFITEYLAQ